MAPINQIRNWVRGNISPRVTSLYARLGLANRARLAENLKGMTVNSQQQTIEQLARQGVLKWRFYKELASNAKATVADIQPFMLSGRVTPARLQAISPELSAGVFSSKNALRARTINRGCSIAFYAGAVAAVGLYASLVGSSLFSLLGGTALFSVAAKALNKQARPDTVLQKFDRFNPNSGPGRLVRLGSKLFWPFTLTGVAALSFSLYTFISERYYPRYVNEKQISVSSEDNRVLAEVCNPRGEECVTSELFSYRGSNPTDRARETARGLQEAINNGDLFNGGIKLDGNELTVLDPWLPSWLTWLPMGTTRVMDLSGENLTPQARDARFITFFNHLWSSGIMPASDDLAQARINALEAQLPYRLFRDPKLQGKLELASLYLQLDNYGRVYQLTDEIINFDLSVTTRRPVFYDEAVFLQADTNRLQAMRFWDISLVPRTMGLLREHQARLGDLENGYRSRYNYELINTCLLASQFFYRLPWEGSEACAPDQVARYLHNATFGYNRYSPTFEDNFLAVRSFITTGRYYAANEQYDSARREYQNALALIDLIDSCNNATRGDPAVKWSAYSPYMRDADRWIGEQTGIENGLWSYARRCELDRALRRDIPPLNRPEQFDPLRFGVFRAKAYQGLAEMEIRLADRDRSGYEQRLLQASAHLVNALKLVRGIQRVDIFRFYTGMFEERETYYQVLVDNAEVLLALHDLRPRERRGSLEQVRLLAEEVASQRGQEELDILYLRARFVLATLDLINGQTDRARDNYAGLLRIIEQAESNLPAGRTMPPHFQFLKESLQIRLAVLQP